MTLFVIILLTAIFLVAVMSPAAAEIGINNFKTRVKFIMTLWLLGMVVIVFLAMVGVIR